MKKLPLLLVALSCFGGLGLSAVRADTEIIVENGHPIHYHRKTVYIIENHRPIQREVFVGEDGRYFTVVEGRRVFIERHFDNYPTKYFHRDGRVREGVTINF